MQDQFDVIGGILSPVHDEYGTLHKPSLRAVNGEHRVAMARLATDSSDWIGVSDFEVQAEGWSLVADVMDLYGKALNGLYVGDEKIEGPAPSRVHLKFLGGTDVLKSMTVPDLWSNEHQETILGQHGFVAIERAGDPLDDAFFESHSLFSKHKESIHGMSPSIENTISSTKVRELIKRGGSIKYLLPDSVIEYIQEHSLYV